MKTRRPATRPCVSCPYRTDAPAGLWHPDEYAKLPAYDRDTAQQPTGVFLCHQQDNRVCAGWAGCHNTDHLLALRLAPAFGTMDLAEVEATLDYVSPVPLFRSGAEAAAHGLSAVDGPDERAQQLARRYLARATQQTNEKE